MKDVADLRAALGTPTVEEIITEASRSGTADNSMSTYTKPPSRKDPEKRLNTLVSVVVFLNMVSMCISVDNNPDHVGWLVFEVCCVAIFITEVVVKLRRWGARAFFCGASAAWNIADTIITTIAIMEVMLSIVEKSSSSLDLADGGNVASAARVAVMLRALRLVRVVRLVRLVSHPMMRDLANMLVGFVIGLPSLLWVLMFFLLILCLLGLTFRILFGPAGEERLVDTCGSPDDMVVLTDLDCPVHWMYGEEFFSSVPLSMFTVFRFMLGDYSTRGGKSLIVAFSQGYGPKFDMVFVAWMIVVIFGLFNIITAIFVDTTVAGLKHNDVKRKYALQYKRQYVGSKLKQVVHRIQRLLTDMRDEETQSTVFDVPRPSLCSTDFSEDEYIDIMEDEYIKAASGFGRGCLAVGRHVSHFRWRRQRPRDVAGIGGRHHEVERRTSKE